MVVLNEGEFERLFAAASQKTYYENDPIWNEIAKYKTALRNTAGRKIANDLIEQEIKKGEGKTNEIEDFLDVLFNMDFCAEQIIGELESEFPPNMLNIFDSLEQISHKAEKEESDRLKEYSVDLKNEIASDPSTLYYQKFIGDLYNNIKCLYLVGKELNRKNIEDSISQAITENGGILEFEEKLNRYFSEIRRERILELHQHGEELFKIIFNVNERNKEFVMRCIRNAEIDWYKHICPPLTRS